MVARITIWAAKTCFATLLQKELVNRVVSSLTTHDLNLARNQQVVASCE